MTERRTLSTLLAELGRRSGLDGLALDADGMCALAVGERVVLHIGRAGDEEDRAIVSVRLPAIPDHARERCYRLLLEANAAPPLDGAVMALDSASGTPLLICRTELAGMGGAEFEAVIEQVARAAESWIERAEADAVQGD